MDKLKNTITITTEDVDDIIINDHIEFSLIKSHDFGWIVKQVVTNDYYEINGYLGDNGEIVLLDKTAKQVFPIKKECIVYE